jgi:hypothetical protein
MEGSPWNSLEAVKVAVAILTPVLILVLTYIVNRAARRVEDAQWANRKLIERRLDVYDRMAPGLNDLYCFFATVGDFREIEPPDAVDRKRKLDKEFHVNKYLFSKQFGDFYRQFIRLAFEENVDYATDARIRADPETQEDEMGKDRWKDGWGKLFSPKGKRNSRFEINQAYERLMECFAQELGVTPRQELKAA